MGPLGAGGHSMGADLSKPADRTIANWIAVDWGTSNLRLWAMAQEGAVLGERSAPRGMGGLAPQDYEAVLLDLAAPFLAPDRATQVLVCGMAGARQGWIEAPYLAVPCAPDGRGAVTAPTVDPRLDVRILPGLSQDAPPDVMRGEETQIAGFLREVPGFAGVLCLPGTHGKWARVADGQVLGFRTALTGEMFALLAEGSVLRHSVGPGWDEAAFGAAVDEMARQPGALPAALFSVRAASLLAGQGPAAARARLSGLLIGAELAAMRDLWQDRPVMIIGESSLAAHYQTALARLGNDADLRPAAGLVLSGLAAARAELGRGRA